MDHSDMQVSTLRDPRTAESVRNFKAGFRDPRTDFSIRTDLSVRVSLNRNLVLFLFGDFIPYSTRNFTLISDMKSKISFCLRIVDKNRFSAYFSIMPVNF